LDKQTYLFILLGGQLVLLALDLGERYRTRHCRAYGLRPGTLLFLAATILVYGGLQFGGLALVPNAEQVLVSSQAFVTGLLGPARGAGLDASVIVLVGIASFYFAGLCGYLFHRFVSHSRPMWFSHENHHLTKDVSVYMPGLCVRPFAVVIVFPTTAVTILSVQLALGASGYNDWDMMPVLYSIVLVQTSILGITHSAFLRRCWWLHDMLRPLGITTPQEHWLHHTADLECNYGNFTTLWDRVFGTYVDPRGVNIDEHRAGLAYDQDFLGAITLGKLKLSASARRRFQLDNFCYFSSENSS